MMIEQSLPLRSGRQGYSSQEEATVVGSASERMVDGSPEFTTRRPDAHPKSVFLEEAEWFQSAALPVPRVPDGAPRRRLLPEGEAFIGSFGSERNEFRPQRLLGGDDKDNAVQSVFVDTSGTAYEPYSLAWRYLGMYIDCGEEENENGDRRRLSKDDKNDCTRKLLWAAVSLPLASIGAWHVERLSDPLSFV
jgi:hypothetical protein